MMFSRHVLRSYVVAVTTTTPPTVIQVDLSMEGVRYCTCTGGVMVCPTVNSIQLCVCKVSRIFAYVGNALVCTTVSNKTDRVVTE